MCGGWAYIYLQTEAVFDGLIQSRSLTVSLTLLVMLFVGVMDVAVLGYRAQLQRRRADKPVNDSFGHAAGDELLRQVGDRLTTCLRQGDVLVRVGGDEFVLLLPGLVNGRDAEVVVRRVRGLLETAFEIFGRTVQIGASVGVHLAGAAESPEMVLRAADEAMYAVKRATGRR